MTNGKYKDEVFDAFCNFLEKEWAVHEGLEDGQVGSLVEFLSRHATETLHALQVLAHD